MLFPVKYCCSRYSVISYLVLFLLDSAFLSGSVCLPHLLESSCLHSGVCAQIILCLCMCLCSNGVLVLAPLWNTFLWYVCLRILNGQPCVITDTTCLSHYLSARSSPNEQLCFWFRICHCEGDDESPLITPCHCTGSLHFVHQACLQQWIKSSDTRCCELCKYEFIMETKLKPLRKVGIRPASPEKCFVKHRSTLKRGCPCPGACSNPMCLWFCGTLVSLVSFLLVQKNLN